MLISATRVAAQTIAFLYLTVRLPRLCRRYLVLRPGAAGASYCADNLASFNQGNATARSDDTIQRQHIQIVITELDRIFEGLGFAAKADCCMRLVLGNLYRRQLRTVHASECHQIAARIQHRDVKLSSRASWPRPPLRRSAIRRDRRIWQVEAIFSGTTSNGLIVGVYAD